MILITGEGRSGTTLLLQIFYLLGFDTGGDAINTGPHEWLKGRKIDSNTKFPEVIKHLGGFIVNLKTWVLDNNWQVDHIFYMANNLDITINKRLYAGDKTRVKISPRVNFNMTLNEYQKLTDEEKIELVKNTFQRRLGTAVYNAIDLGIPITIIHYQRFCKDINYAIDVLKPILKLKNLTEKDVKRVHKKWIKLEKVKPWHRVSEKVTQ